MTDSGSEKNELHNEKTGGLHTVASITEDQIGDAHAVITTIISPSGKEVAVTGDVDEAMKLAIKAQGVVLSEADDKRLLRKTELYLMPLLCLIYCIQFMDKVTNSNASIMGLRTDLDMTAEQYSWVGSAFYFGYLVFEFPASYVLQRLPLAKATSGFIIIWGIVLCLHATPNYGGFMFLRVTLGALESAITPCMVILMSQWFKTEEQFFHTNLFFGCNGFGTIFGSGIAYGLAIRDDDAYSIAKWKVLFIICGCITIFIGIIFPFHIPDTPAGAWFLTEEEKLMVVERIRKNNQGFGNRHFKMHQFKEALLDYRTWICFFFGLASDIPNGGLTNFSSILLSDDFGFSVTKTLLMNMPAGGVEVVGCWLFGATHHLFPQRLLIAIAATVLTLVSACMLAFANKSKEARLAGYYIMSVSPVGMICCLSLFASNTAGHTKKFTTNAIFLIGYCAGNIIGPQTFRANQAPGYSGAKIAIVVCYAFSLALLVALYFSYSLENKKRDKLAAEKKLQGEDEIFMENQEFADLTDFENPHFRYAL